MVASQMTSHASPVSPKAMDSAIPLVNILITWDTLGITQKTVGSHVPSQALDCNLHAHEACRASVFVPEAPNPKPAQS